MLLPTGHNYGGAGGTGKPAPACPASVMLQRPSAAASISSGSRAERHDVDGGGCGTVTAVAGGNLTAVLAGIVRAARCNGTLSWTVTPPTQPRQPVRLVAIIKDEHLTGLVEDALAHRGHANSAMAGRGEDTDSGMVHNPGSRLP